MTLLELARNSGREMLDLLGKEHLWNGEKVRAIVKERKTSDSDEYGVNQSSVVVRLHPDDVEIPLVDSDVELNGDLLRVGEAIERSGLLEVTLKRNYA